MRAALRTMWQEPVTRRRVIGIAVLLLLLFMLFDLRAGGMERNFSVLNLADPAWVLENFGPLWIFGGLALNIVLAVGTALLITLALANARDRRAATACSTGAVAPVALGFGAFTCPGCVLPIGGLLGASVMGTSLPLLGLEFKILAVALVVGALLWVARAQRADAGDEAGVDSRA